MMVDLKMQALSVGILIALLGGTIALQIFLSRRQSRWPGLVLPLICVLVSVFAVLGMARYTTISSGEVYYLADGKVVESYTHKDVQSKSALTPMGGTETFTAVIVPFLLLNIPTLVLLAIYFACREKRRRQDGVQRMRAQDLE